MLSVLVSFAIHVVLGWSITVWAVRRMAPSAAASYTFKPISLLVVAGAVAFTRVTDFEPGIVFGLVAGVAFAGLLEASGEARASTSSAWATARGSVLRHGFSTDWSRTRTEWRRPSSPRPSPQRRSPGLQHSPIALFPVPGMPGKTIFTWSAKTWVACYVLGLVAFFVVLMPTPYAWDEVAWSLRAWVLVYLAYLTSAVVIWAVVTRIGRSSLPPSMQHPTEATSEVG